MAGGMRKLGLYLGLVEDDDRKDGYYDDREGGYDDGHPGYDDRAEERQPVRRFDSDRAAPRTAGVRAGGGDTRGALALEDTRPVAVLREDAGGEPQYRITTLHPRTYNEARTIGEHFRDGTPVIMNLTEMDDSDAKRLVDFAAGLIFGLHGSLERVTARVFLLSPADVSVTAEDKQRIAEGGFFNQS